MSLHLIKLIPNIIFSVTCFVGWIVYNLDHGITNEHVIILLEYQKQYFLNELLFGQDKKGKREFNNYIHHYHKGLW
jgi:hypothetical protein